MVVSIQSAENALKNLYLGVVAEQLNLGINPLYAKIKQTSADVWGKQVVKLVQYGINGGIGAGGETTLPIAGGNNYIQLKSDLKNLYGSLDITDKALRASENSQGAFVNLLNAEMEGLLKASKFNFGRMLFSDGNGKLATLTENSGQDGVLKVDSTKKLMEGMQIDIWVDDDKVDFSCRILMVDRVNKTIKIETNMTYEKDMYITIQGSRGLELTGLGAIFSDKDIYGLSRDEYKWLNPYIDSTKKTISSNTIQTAMDFIDETTGAPIDTIITSYDVKRFYLEYLNMSRTNIDFMNLDGGYKALSYNGIPLIADRFVDDGTMYLLNTNDFSLNQLCDWRWLEDESGRILRQKPNAPVYSATLVKYADLICSRPIGQAKISNIKAEL